MVKKVSNVFFSMFYITLLFISLLITVSCTTNNKNPENSTNAECKNSSECDEGFICDYLSETCIENKNISNSNSNSNSNNNSNNINNNSSQLPDPPPGNMPPVINMIPAQRIIAGNELIFNVSANDPDGDSLTFSAHGLPSQAEFNSETATFSWTPELSESGTYSYVTIYVSDGWWISETTVEITVLERSENEEPVSPIPNCLNNTIPCFGECCPSGQLCFNGACRIPGDLCDASIECPMGSYCEPLLSECLSLPENQELGCVYEPLQGIMYPNIQWVWNGETSTMPEYNQVLSMPLILNLSDDNADGQINIRDIPDVAFVSFNANGGDGATGILRILSGDDGHEILTKSDIGLSIENQPAGGDIDDDGIAEMIFVTGDNKLVCFEHNGILKWISTETVEMGWGGPAIANIDGVGTPEIVAGAAVFNANGALLWKHNAVAKNLGILTLVANLIPETPEAEILVGNKLYSHTGEIIWHSQARSGLTAVGDMDNDSVPEIIMIADGKAYILSNMSEVMCGPVNIPGGGRGGAPTIADFDGDGDFEFATAGSTMFTVFESDCSVKWSQPIKDLSSNVTASSVFDFDADGAAEVVYNDEEYLRVYNGSSGDVMFEFRNPTNTTYEYPIVVDVDNDANAEIVVVANNFIHDGTPGIKVFYDKMDNWVNTRRIWNQHTYHINNINENSSIPIQENNSWETHNTYRLNRLDDNLFISPDIIIELFIDYNICPHSLLFTVRLQNVGNLGVRAQMPVSFYRRVSTEQNPILLATVQTTEDLYPGGEVFVEYEWEIPSELQNEGHNILVRADDDGSGAGTHNECTELNNTALFGNIICSTTNCEDNFGTLEICDNLDNDCDGITDEGAEQGELIQKCDTACGEGYMICKSGAWSPCLAPEATPEICDGVDNNCDGDTDENLPECVPDSSGD